MKATHLSTIPESSPTPPPAKRRLLIWFMVSVGINVLLAIGLLGVTLNLIPLHPFLAEHRGGAIITAPNAEAWQTTVLLFDKLGNGPRYTTSNPDVTRAFMRNGEIINLPTPQLHAKLGNDIVASRYFVVKDPTAQAKEAADFLQQRGYTTNVIIDAEKKLNPGAMAVVTSNAFPGWAMVLRKSGPLMGEPLQPWSWSGFADRPSQ